ncbi:LexA family protein [Entomomonas asaccharolytica]|uniref:Helix-turn-helix domain-containing protein n=1 Tax=Entomomonas asaccharolytica TaxID=2785331 RepID=A0A974RZB8_9GAMM|nr:LexA family transcriptional regulator [Entomomonas asaccharolytica]QQP86914.1 helix-turn-helix domain-containing protein [Entomomonas asaccharolytica]
MNDWKKLAKEQMKQLKISQYALAEKLDCSQGAVAHWLSGRRTADIDTINNILEALSLPPLSIGGTKLSSNNLSYNEINNVKSVQSQPHVIKPFSYPVINWDDVEKYLDKRLSSNLIRGALMSSKNIKKGFWLEVIGNSMWSSNPMNKITFPSGTMILIDPNFNKLEHGKFYIVEMPDGSKTFKQLLRDAGQSYLNSLNDNFKPIPIDEAECKFLGKVIDRNLGDID